MVDKISWVNRSSIHHQRQVTAAGESGEPRIEGQLRSRAASWGQLARREHIYGNQFRSRGLYRESQNGVTAVKKKEKCIKFILKSFYLTRNSLDNWSGWR